MSNSINATTSCNSRTSPAIGVVLFLVCLLAPYAQADEWHFSSVERVVAFGDVHGALDELTETLQKAGVIDEEHHWIGGKTHLVSTGDLLDRGADSRRVMNLMMRLEREALVAGGRVHQLLGNHEVMNLIGDLRYVSNEEYAAFRDFELPEKREHWYRQFRLRQPVEADDAAIRHEFDKKAPPGYFGHRRAFGLDGPYGRWLLEKPFMVVINDTVFVHGGASAYVIDNGIAGVNVTLKDELSDYLRTAEALVDAGILTPLDRYMQIPKFLGAMLDTEQLPGTTEASARKLIAFVKSPLQGQPGPTWYRGNALCGRFVELPTLDAALSELRASRVVVGHTTTQTRRVQQRLDGRVIQIDTGMLNKTYGGSGNALVIENGMISVVNQDGTTTAKPIELPLQVGYRDVGTSEEDLARTLEAGSIVAVAAEGTEWQLLQVEGGDLALLAVFRALPGTTEFAPELAAYRLDRQLKLGMVPVTVRRTVAGRRGTLQFVPGVTLTERERVAAGQSGDVICSLDKQQDAMLVFDALAHNAARTPSSMVYDRDNWLLMLIDHENSFGVATDLPDDLMQVGRVVSDEWRAALRALDDDILQAVLGDALNEERLTALGKRRDALIALGD